jgi:hypothetical protein
MRFVAVQVSGGGSRFYIFNILDSTKDTLVSVGLTQGSVQLYFADIKSLSSATQPSPQNGYDFAADASFQSTGQFRVTAAMLSFNCQARIAGGAACPLYIGVYNQATTISSFVLTVVQSSATEYTQLTEGISVVNTVNASESRYYLATVNEPTNDDLYVTLLSFNGDADLYVNIGQNPPFPTPTSYNYSALHVTGPDVVHISSADALYCASCTLAITVVGFRSALYSLTYTSAYVCVWGGGPNGARLRGGARVWCRPLGTGGRIGARPCPARSPPTQLSVARFAFVCCARAGSQCSS